jgi:hypothetical protein
MISQTAFVAMYPIPDPTLSLGSMMAAVMPTDRAKEDERRR